jgi:tetratricopeptide (TPR) repeat protein
LQHDRFEEAAVDFHQAVAIKPNSPWAHLGLARVYQKQNKFDESNQQFDDAIKCKPLPKILAECHLAKARNLGFCRQYAAALKACDEALRIVPDEPPPLLEKAQALLGLERHAEAAKALEEYRARKGPAGPDFFRARGQARLHLRLYVGAIADLERVLEQEPDARTYGQRGWACYFAEAWKPGLNDFEEAVRRDAKNADHYIGRGLCRVMLGRYREAVDDAETAARRRPSTPELTHNLACIFALAVAKVNNDAGVEDRRRLASLYCERAVSVLHQALALVAEGERARFWQQKVLPDTALDAIRVSAGFKELAGKYPQK